MNAERTEGYVIRWKNLGKTFYKLSILLGTNDLENAEVMSLKRASMFLQKLADDPTTEIVRVRRVVGPDIWCRYADSNFRITKNDEIMSVSDGYWIEHRTRGEPRWEVCDD